MTCGFEKKNKIKWKTTRIISFCIAHSINCSPYVQAYVVGAFFCPYYFFLLLPPAPHNEKRFSKFFRKKTRNAVPTTAVVLFIFSISNFAYGVTIINVKNNNWSVSNTRSNYHRSGGRERNTLQPFQHAKKKKRKLKVTDDCSNTSFIPVSELVSDDPRIHTR